MVRKTQRDVHAANRNRKQKHGTRQPKDTILIACEGHTEAAYFQDMGQHHRMAVTALPLARSCESLVFEAEKINEQDGPYNEVWVVFDKDAEEGRFNHGIQMAHEKNISVAYSNESFELWFCLHFDYIDAGLTREQYCEKMTAYLGTKYRKPHPDIYWSLEPRQNQAIRFAERLMSNYQVRNPYRDNPSTTVHELVERLQLWRNQH